MAISFTYSVVGSVGIISFPIVITIPVTASSIGGGGRRPKRPMTRELAMIGILPDLDGGEERGWE